MFHTYERRCALTLMFTLPFFAACHASDGRRLRLILMPCRHFADMIMLLTAAARHDFRHF